MIIIFLVLFVVNIVYILAIFYVPKESPKYYFNSLDSFLKLILNIVFEKKMKIKNNMFEKWI